MSAPVGSHFTNEHFKIGRHRMTSLFQGPELSWRPDPRGFAENKD